MASIIIRPASIDFCWWARKEIQLGRYEYCEPTIALSPLYIISIAAAAVGLIQPVPVVGTMTRTSRSNAPVRSSSLSSTAMRASSDSAVCNPA